MRNYNQINNILGWMVFAIATAVYVLTLEPTASFWDCGEFIACSYKLLVPHPPGAPLFLLIGRLFSLLSFGDVTKVAWWVNIVSALSSSFTVLFLFWTITHLARKLVSRVGEELSQGQVIGIMGSGVVGALALTFSDSFWFSAVEAEVYAMSAFFTAFVVWAMLKWETKADSPEADKWLILIAYAVGLSIGVHLLNLLAIPALGLIYYFTKHRPTQRGLIITFGVSLAIIGVILVGVIPGLPSIAGWFEIHAVNDIGLPIGTGVIVFCLLALGALIYGLRYSIRRNMRALNTALLCLTFILIGYSSYLIIPIRSGYNPTIDENDPENIISFVSYLKREQYGDRPLLYGPTYNAEVESQDEGAPKYMRQGDKYVVYDHSIKQVYKKDGEMLFPRIYSPQHVDEYKKWVDLQEGRKPTMGQNLSYFFRYQLGHMYWRYFGWNFIGRDSDIQQSGVLWPWESSRNLPERIGESMARNNFFMLPFILGVAGLLFQFKRNSRDAWMVTLLFVLTGIAIVVYLNQPPIEPRERDYTFAGSFYAFAIWIGLGVLAVAELLRKMLANTAARMAAATVVCLIVPVIMAAQGWDDHDRSNRYHSVDSAKNLLNSCAPNAILFTNGDNDTFPLWYAQEVEGVRTDVRVAVLSYLNTDWYISQMKRRSYESQPLPITMADKSYLQGTNDVVYFQEKPQVKAGMDLRTYINLVDQSHPAIQIPYGGTRTLLSFPTKKFFLPVDKAAAAQAVPADRQSQIVDRIDFQVNKSAIEKKNLVILDMLATISRDWKRPIYFSTTVAGSDFLGLDKYFQLEGLAYRILPAVGPANQGGTGTIATDIMYDNMMNKFQWRELNNEHVFYDENYMRFPANARDKFFRLTKNLMEKGDNERARKVIEKCFAVMPDKSIPYDYYTPQFIEPMVKLGQQKKALEIINTMSTRSDNALAYYTTADIKNDMEIQANLFILDQLRRVTQQMGMTEKSKEIEKIFMKYYEQMPS